jgi:hypothetical protein
MDDEASLKGVEALSKSLKAIIRYSSLPSFN